MERKIYVPSNKNGAVCSALEYRCREIQPAKARVISGGITMPEAIEKAMNEIGGGGVIVLDSDRENFDAQSDHMYWLRKKREQLEKRWPNLFAIPGLFYLGSKYSQQPEGFFDYGSLCMLLSGISSDQLVLAALELSEGLSKSAMVKDHSTGKVFIVSTQ